MKRKLVVISVFACLVFAGEALAKTKSRPKHLSGEGAVKGNRVDFEEIDIKGGTKAPMMSAVGAGKADKNYDFVKIRQRWHPEMVASTATLD